MLIVDARLRVPLAEFTFTYAKSGGPGGQNVNKLNTKATLRWAVATTPSLPEDVRQRFMATYRTRITTEGELVLTSQRTREALANTRDCLEKLAALLRTVATAPKRRKATKPTRGSVERRHAEKRRRSARKAGRRGAADE